jgi:hypothetical protein
MVAAKASKRINAKIFPAGRKAIYRCSEARV